MKMLVFKGTSILVLGLCLLILNKAKGEEEGNGVNQVWNFFFGNGETPEPTYNCPAEPVTCETRNASVAYVRWGRDDCNPDTSDIVYSGKVTKCYYEFECYEDHGGSRSLLYGAEYETNTYAPFSDVHDGDIVCALCLARGRSTTSMIPAKRTCPSGWTKEYGGLLMGSVHGHGGHDYLCIDRNPQARHGSSVNNNGHLFYATEGVCGSLPCPPYANGNEITCVVCSR
ncbi:short-chain collagen C4-like [Anneissia japonica]|uniref:short-chain collagen C4-like n=1 Tax=Anneissia japonica TaxID=1529436 RepID=UPI00142592D9|nr:short-chain collagen C4-like [Anneissia japonica]